MIWKLVALTKSVYYLSTYLKRQGKKEQHSTIVDTLDSKWLPPAKYTRVLPLPQAERYSIIIIIIIIIPFMQGIYTYIPETHHIPREHSVADILFLLFMVLILLVSVLNPLYFYISTFRSMCAVPNMAVF